MRKKKAKIAVKNGMRDKVGTILGDTDTKTGKIRINVKAHKGDRKQLASTVKHELMHANHPRMTEKQVYKRTGVSKITPHEETKLLAKLRMKKLNYKSGAIKRKYKLGKVATKPGELITHMNAQKVAQNKGKTDKPVSPSMRASIMGA